MPSDYPGLYRSTTDNLTRQVLRVAVEGSRPVRHELRYRRTDQPDTPATHLEESYLRRLLLIPTTTAKPSKMQPLNLLELIPRCHEAAKAKGFWDVTPNRSQQLMLAVSELSEALEADRKGRTAAFAAFQLEVEAEHPEDATHFASCFQAHIKDSPGDELADAYIRLCDFAGGFGLDAEEVAAEHEALECPENFAEALLGITAIICMTDYELDMAERAVGMALAHIQALCQARNIDLATHIDLKLRYNATRPRLHAKAY